MNLLFLTEGGARTGYGHLCRSLALAQAFDDTRAVNKTKFVVCADGRARKFLKKNNVIFSNVDWLRNPDRIQKFIRGETAIIVDSYLASRSLYKRLRKSKRNPYVVAVDDNNRIPYDADAIINYSVNKGGPLGYKKSSRTKYLVGNEYLIVRREFYGKRPPATRKAVHNILIILSGTDCDRLRDRIIRLFGNSGYCLHVVLPKGKRHSMRGGDRTKFYYDLNSKQLSSLMKEMDLCISGGGHVLNELACLGIPAIAVGLARNQMENIRRWGKAGFIKYAGWHQDKDLFGRLRKSVSEMEVKEVRARQAKNGIKVLNATGRERIVKTLMADYYKRALTFRKACLRDARGMFDISNDPLVRKVSFNSDRISWPRHMRWLKERLADDQCVFYVCATPEKIYAQVRFDVDSREHRAVISVSLHEDIRGLGLSSWILTQCVQAFLTEQRGVHRIQAFIKTSNRASIRAFQKAQFRYTKNVLVQGHASRMYVFTRRRGC